MGALNSQTEQIGRDHQCHRPNKHLFSLMLTSLFQTPRVEQYVRGIHKMISHFYHKSQESLMFCLIQWWCFKTMIGFSKICGRWGVVEEHSLETTEVSTQRILWLSGLAGPVAAVILTSS